MTKHKLIILAALSLVTVFACEKKVGKLPETTATPVTPVSANACDTITYEKHIKPIFTLKCLSCHASGTSTPDLSTYSSLKSRALSGTLKLRVIDPADGAASLMPQGGPKLQQSQLNLIQCWINNGAKEK